jgi:hypothetical protein
MDLAAGPREEIAGRRWIPAVLALRLSRDVDRRRDRGDKGDRDGDG